MLLKNMDNANNFQEIKPIIRYAFVVNTNCTLHKAEEI
jgi:hypothetical protein